MHHNPMLYDYVDEVVFYENRSPRTHQTLAGVELGGDWVKSKGSNRLRVPIERSK